MKCPSRYAELQCALTGVGFIHTPAPIGALYLTLVNNHANHFPTLQVGEWFFAHITDACTNMCTKVKIVGVDKVTGQLLMDAPLVACIPSLSRVSYDSTSVEAIREIAEGVGINVVYPLVYDCETRTLSIDCQGLRDLMDNCQGEGV